MFEPFYRKTERHLTKYISSRRGGSRSERRAELIEWLGSVATSMNTAELEQLLYMLYKSVVPVPSVLKHLDNVKHKEEDKGEEYRGFLWMVQDQGSESSEGSGRR